MLYENVFWWLQLPKVSASHFSVLSICVPDWTPCRTFTHICPAQSSVTCVISPQQGDCGGGWEDCKAMSPVTDTMTISLLAVFPSQTLTSYPLTPPPHPVLIADNKWRGGLICASLSIQFLGVAQIVKQTSFFDVGAGPTTGILTYRSFVTLKV